MVMPKVDADFFPDVQLSNGNTSELQEVNLRDINSITLSQDGTRSTFNTAKTPGTFYGGDLETLFAQFAGNPAAISVLEKITVVQPIPAPAGPSVYNAAEFVKAPAP